MQLMHLVNAIITNSRLSNPLRYCVVRGMDLVYDTRHLCMRLRTDGIKAMSRGFLSGGGQTSEKNCQWKKSRSSLFILDDRK